MEKVTPIWTYNLYMTETAVDRESQQKIPNVL